MWVPNSQVTLKSTTCIISIAYTRILISNKLSLLTFQYWKELITPKWYFVKY